MAEIQKAMKNDPFENLMIIPTLIGIVMFHNMMIYSHSAYDVHNFGCEYPLSIPDEQPKGKMWSHKSGSFLQIADHIVIPVNRTKMVVILPFLLLPSWAAPDDWLIHACVPAHLRIESTSPSQ